MTQQPIAENPGIAGVTWDTYVELGKPKDVTVYPASALREGGTYVCSTYVLGQPFISPGNIVKGCAACGNLIQMRPHAPEQLRKICIPCALLEGFVIPDPPESVRRAIAPRLTKARR